MALVNTKFWQICASQSPVATPSPVNAGLLWYEMTVDWLDDVHPGNSPSPSVSLTHGKMLQFTWSLDGGHVWIPLGSVASGKPSTGCVPSVHPFGGLKTTFSPSAGTGTGHPGYTFAVRMKSPKYCVGSARYVCWRMR